MPNEIADTLGARLSLVRGKTAPDKPLDLRPVEGVAGLHSVLTPRFLPTESRHRFREVFDHAGLRIEVDLPPPEPARPRLVAADEATRQERRQSWTQRNAYNRLPDKAVARIEACGRADLAVLLRLPRPRRRRAASG